jgi:hypothetical protein
MADFLSRGERVIIETRYGGAYEGGQWAAFSSPEIPEEARGEDVECRSWWEAPTVAVGVSSTPDEALEILERAVRTCDHPQDSRVPLPAGYECGYCKLLIRPSTGTVEDLLSVVSRWSSQIPLNLWVPDALTLKGDPVAVDVAMAIVVDAALAIGLFPKGSTEEDGGRHCHPLSRPRQLCRLWAGQRSRMVVHLYGGTHPESDWRAMPWCGPHTKNTTLDA